MEFSQGIIAIVGPNGSGKSNVADSLRWVLGEQSTKMIRGKSSQDVIFAGSEKKARLGFAEVSATFDNRDHRIPVDAAEVSIGRRIDRSGESEYLINGNKVRLLDIVDLVLRSNIGTSRYTVIGQGTIDQMILAGPSEVKNLLDEASGVKNYYIKRDRTLRRLEQTAQNLMRAEDLIAEIEPRLKSLRRQAKRMEARAEIEQELKGYQKDFFGRNYWSLKTSIDTYVARLKELGMQRFGMEQKMFSLRQQAESIEQQNSEHASEYREIQSKMAALQSQKNKLLEDLSLVRGKMQSEKTSAGDAKTLQIQLHEIVGKLEETMEKIVLTTGDIEKSEASAKLHAEKLTVLNDQLNKLYSSMQQPASVDFNALEHELSHMEGKLQEFYAQLEQEQPLSVIRTIADNLKAGFERLKAAVRSSVQGPQAQVQFQQQLQELLKEREQVNQAVSAMELSLSKSRIYVEFLEKQESDLKQQKLQLELELKHAESQSTEEFLESLLKEETRIKGEAQALATQINELEQSFRSQNEAERQKQLQLHDIESNFRKAQDELSKLKDEISAVSVEKAKYDTQMEVLTEEIRRILGEESLAHMQQVPAEPKEMPAEGQPSQEELSMDALLEKITRLKNQLDMIGGIDELTMKEYQETEVRYTNLSSQVNDLKKSMQDLRTIMDELDEHIRVKFNEAFHRINDRFEHYFRLLFNGGRAYLSLVKSDDAQEEEQEQAQGEPGQVESADTEPQDQLRPEEKIVQKYEKGASNIIGVDIKATPPGKKLQNIQALSGGERSLTSIALLCSLLTCFPSPFVVLDEVDAALDDANTIRFGQILGTLAHQTQFITITHNRETMAQANILYGVTMGDDGISKLLSVKLEQAKAYAK